MIINLIIRVAIASQVSRLCRAPAPARVIDAEPSESKVILTPSNASLPPTARF